MNRSRGARIRDLLALLIGGGVLAWSLARPTLLDLERGGRLDRAAADVAAVVAASQAYADQRGDAPPGAESGRAPDALAPWLRGAVPFAGDGYRLDLDRWIEVVVPPPPAVTDPADSVAVPPPFSVGRSTVSVHSGHLDLLAHLVDTYGPSSSFVRDTTWTLVLDPVYPTEEAARRFR